MLVAMETTHRRHKHVVILVVSMVIATNDVNAVGMTTVSSASSLDNNLTLLLLTPFDGILGFERNAAASTLALKQAQADGLLSGVNITYVHFLILFPGNIF